MITDTTSYSIRSEEGASTTITLQKAVADILQSELPDVHAWVQDAYCRTATKYPKLSRRKKGDLVRAMSIVEARRSPLYAEVFNALL